MNTGCRTIVDSGRPAPERSSTVGRGTCTSDWTASATTAYAASTTNPPRNGVAKRSAARRTDSGPTKPPTMPPASTSEIARGLSAGADDLGRREAILQSERVVHADDRRRHAVEREAPAERSRNAASAQPPILISAPAMKPAAASDARHPQRRRHRRQPPSPAHRRSRRAWQAPSCRPASSRRARSS